MAFVLLRHTPQITSNKRNLKNTPISDFSEAAMSYTYSWAMYHWDQCSEFPLWISWVFIIWVYAYSLIICSLLYIYLSTLLLLGTILSPFPHAPRPYQWFQTTSPVSLWHQFNFQVCGHLVLSNLVCIQPNTIIPKPHSLGLLFLAENITIKLVASLWYSDT